MLQLAANIYDATTNSFYPSVFRPIFEHDNLGNVFVTGYTNLSSGFGLNTVTGTNDSQLSQPHLITDLTNLDANFTPITDGSGFFVNVYGVPWIIGAKKGFPNFNEFSMNNVVQITRQVQIKKASTNFPPVFNYTNVTYVFGIGSSLGVEFWNSYATNYSDPIQIVVNDALAMEITNNGLLPPTRPDFIYSNGFSVFTNGVVTAWNPNPQPNSFVFQMTNVTFMTNFAYQFESSRSPPFQDESIAGLETNYTSIPLLPQLYLVTANRLQTFMLDGHQVIDYAQFNGPNNTRNLNAEVQTFGVAEDYTNMWTTNLNAVSGTPIAIINQILASDDGIKVDTSYWKTAPQPYEIDGFYAFITGFNTLPLTLGTATATNDFNYYLTNLIHQTPYTPTVTAYDYTTWQANDPLVHYLASDLNFSGTESGGQSVGSQMQTGINILPDTATNLPSNNLGALNDRYQPWGRSLSTTNSIPRMIWP